MIDRRSFLGTSTGVALAALTGAPAIAQAPAEMRIGYQKNGVLVVARQQAVLEQRFAASGHHSDLARFPLGPAAA